ncbi:MAG: hypothetical protein ABIP13_10480 [Tepidiformaceae bacterium]
MGFFQMISAIGLPVAMVVGAVMAWRMTKRENKAEAEQPGWRDDSLDDWRKERDAEIEVERLQRIQEAKQHGAAASEEQSEKKRHQRIGG